MAHPQVSIGYAKDIVAGRRHELSGHGDGHDGLWHSPTAAARTEMYRPVPCQRTDDPNSGSRRAVPVQLIR